jgi:hypothetical protein
MTCYTRSRGEGRKEGANECLLLPCFVWVVFVGERANGKGGLFLPFVRRVNIGFFIAYS